MVASCLANMDDSYIQKYISHGITPNPKNRNKFIFAFCAWCEKSWLSDFWTSKSFEAHVTQFWTAQSPVPTVPETLITIHLHVQHQTPAGCTLKLLNLCKSRNAFFVDLLINMWKFWKPNQNPQALAVFVDDMNFPKSACLNEVSTELRHWYRVSLWLILRSFGRRELAREKPAAFCCNMNLMSNVWSVGLHKSAHSISN